MVRPEVRSTVLTILVTWTRGWLCRSSTNLLTTMANLPVTINNFVQSPYEYWRQLAWTGALLITLAVLALNIIARLLAAERKKS